MRDHTLRVGRTMEFKSEDDVIHPQSFWCLDDLQIKIGESLIRLEFVGYHNTEAYDNEKLPIAGAKKIYLLADDLYMAAVFSPTQYPKGSPKAKEILTMAWDLALGKKDILGDSPEAITSFFENAVEVV